jgi:hypothetical protein
MIKQNVSPTGALPYFFENSIRVYNLLSNFEQAFGYFKLWIVRFYQAKDSRSVYLKVGWWLNYGFVPIMIL